MLKMEKNFIAQIDKGYPRKPYLEYSIDFLIERLKQEVDELTASIVDHHFVNAESECADVSNVIDYIFEALIRRKIKL